MGLGNPSWIRAGARGGDEFRLGSAGVWVQMEVTRKREKIQALRPGGG